MKEFSWASFAASKPRPCNACTPDSWPHALCGPILCVSISVSRASKEPTRSAAGVGGWTSSAADNVRKRQQTDLVPQRLDRRA